jgi:tRNA nucleotidyltransferase (CCA-adding enzyme)
VLIYVAEKAVKTRRPFPTVTALLAAVAPLTEYLTAAALPWRVVGGAVRDVLLGRPVHDIDIEVVVADLPTLEHALAHVVPGGAVGGDHPAVRWRQGALAIDVSVAAHADLRHAAAARDLTINAIALLPDGTIVDPTGGVADCQAGVLRVLDGAFAADPLRVLRAMRLAAQLDFTPTAATCAAAQAVVARAASIAPARIWHEWRLWALAPFPQRGLTLLYDSGWLAIYPMLAALVGCAQDPIHHPEGDAWVHTLYVCAGMAERRAQLDDEAVIITALAALCHDLGKPSTSVVEGDRITCHGHAAAGDAPTRAFLMAIGAPERFAAPVTALVREHMAANDGAPSPRSVRRLAARLAPAELQWWARLVGADSSGRPPLPRAEPGAPFLAVAEALGAATAPVPALLRGEDVIASGVPAGPRIKTILQAAYEAQLDGVYDSPAGARAWLALHLGTAGGEQ